VDSLDHIPEDRKLSPERMQWEIKMLQSRYESEQRHREQQSKILDASKRMIEIQQIEIQRQAREIEDHRKMLLNTGTGLMFRTRDLENSDKNSKDLLTRIISIGSLIVALFTLLSRYIKI
jgi:hypothetical protein